MQGCDAPLCLELHEGSKHRSAGERDASCKIISQNVSFSLCTGESRSGVYGHLGYADVENMLIPVLAWPLTSRVLLGKMYKCLALLICQTALLVGGRKWTARLLEQLLRVFVRSSHRVCNSRRSRTTSNSDAYFWLAGST